MDLNDVFCGLQMLPCCRVFEAEHSHTKCPRCPVTDYVTTPSQQPSGHGIHQPLADVSLHSPPTPRHKQSRPSVPKTTDPKMASPTTSTLARTLTRTALRPWLRRAALPLGVGLTTGLVAVHHQRPMYFDAVSAPTAAVPQPARAGADKRRDLLDAATIKELSGGSLSGTSRVFLFPCLFGGNLLTDSNMLYVAQGFLQGSW